MAQAVEVVTDHKQMPPGLQPVRSTPQERCQAITARVHIGDDGQIKGFPWHLVLEDIRRHQFQREALRLGSLRSLLQPDHRGVNTDDVEAVAGEPDRVSPRTAPQVYGIPRRHRLAQFDQ